MILNIGFKKKFLCSLLLLNSFFQTSRAFEPVTTAALVFAGWTSIKGYKHFKHKRLNKGFLKAVKGGSRVDARSFLREGADVNVAVDSKTALHIACENGDYSIVKLLLEHGSDLNAIDKQGRTPFIIAVCGGEYHKLSALLSCPYVLVFYDKGGLIFSKIGTQEYRKIASLLLEYGALLDVEDSLGATALEYAVILQDLEMVQKLLATGARCDAIDDIGFTLLDRAVLAQATEIQNELEKYNVPAGPKLFSALIQIGRPEEAIKYIDAIDVNNKEHSNLYWATFARKLALVEALLQRGASVGLVGLTDYLPICHVVGMGKLWAIKLYINYMSVLNLKELTPTLYIELGFFDSTNEETYLSIAQALLKEGINLNISCGLLGMAPLHVAAAVGSRKMVNLLLQNGADPKKRDAKLGKTPYDHAKFFGHKDVMYILQNA